MDGTKMKRKEKQRRELLLEDKQGKGELKVFGAGLWSLVKTPAGQPDKNSAMAHVCFAIAFTLSRVNLYFIEALGTLSTREKGGVTLRRAGSKEGTIRWAGCRPSTTRSTTQSSLWLRL
jgi:hypothetical protein